MNDNWFAYQNKKDEVGTAAIKTFELDAILGGRAVQYRELQGHETEKFLSYFRPCIIPQEGGMASGCRPAEVDSSEHETRLYVCKGRHVVHVKEASFTVDNIYRHTFDILLVDLFDFSVLFIRFHLLDLRLIMMIYSFWIPSLWFFSSMVRTHLFKRGLKLLKLCRTLRTHIMMGSVKLQLLVCFLCPYLSLCPIDDKLNVYVYHCYR